MSTPPDPSPLRAFELEKYARDREHELELNRFTHRFEVERLKLLILLNGGAATAWLSLGQSDAGLDPLAIGAAAFWVIGLCLSVWATQAALETQRQFGRAYHSRRRADEAAILATSARAPKADDLEPGESHVAAFDRKADTARKAGEASAKRVWRRTICCTGAFLAGAVAAAASLIG